MTQESPFGIRRPAPDIKDENSIRFAALKPICVELLGSIAKNKDGADIGPVFALMKKLDDTLSSFVNLQPDRTPHSLSLINYVFFPLAQLLRSTSKGESDLPDRVRQILFHIFSSLASDWWQAWTDRISSSSAGNALKVTEQWKVWEQLLILGAVALGGPPDESAIKRKVSSEETQLSICSFLQELLLPRLAVKPSNVSKAAQEWEWDGEEELPSLDDYDAFQEAATVDKEDLEQMYPSTAHLQHVSASKSCRGAIAHALTASLDLASGNIVSAQVRIACIKVSRTIISIWLANESPQAEDPTSLFKQVSVGKIFNRPREDHYDASNTLQADRVAVFLPGYVSSMIRILGLASTRDNSWIISEALFSLAVILRICLDDDACAGLTTSNNHHDARVRQAASIDELVAQMNIEDREKGNDNSAVLSADKDNSTPKLNVNSTNRTSEWLENTMAHVVIALYSINTISSQSHARVQLALIHLAYTILARCSMVLDLQRKALMDKEDHHDSSIDATRLLLRWIVDIAANDSSTTIAVTSANHNIRQLFYSRSGLYKKAIIEEMLDIVQVIPALLASQNDGDCERRANRLRFLLSLSTSGFDRSMPVFPGIQNLLQPSSGVDKWGLALLWSIKIDEQASIEPNMTSFALQGMSASASKAVLGIFEEIGRALCRLITQECMIVQEKNASFSLVWSFMNEATANRSTLIKASGGGNHNHLLCQNALIIVHRMLRGVAELFDDAILALQTSKEGKKIRRIAHRFAKEMIGRVGDLLAEDEEELLQQDFSIRRESQSSAERGLQYQEQNVVAAVEQSSGIETQGDTSFERPAGFGPALKLDFVSSATLSNATSLHRKPKTALQIQKQAKDQLDRSDALLLSILNSSARLLGPSLKPLLLKMLYPIICGVASQSSTIREAALQSMDEMARSAGYASVQGCVLDHADYILGTASHRLVSTLGQELQAIASRDKGNELVHSPLISAQSAPLVLVEIIRMLGEEALTLVQDAIDEVLDAIDRYHQQEGLCDDLLNVLSRLVEVMLEDERTKDSRNRKRNESSVKSATVAFRPDVDHDMEALQMWWNKRQAKEAMSNTPLQQEAEALDEEAQQGQDEQDTSTPSQTVVVSMLEKAVPFLSHSSAMIRIRCLRLINWGIELLCMQGRTVEPLQVVNKAWPTIMSRLGFSVSLSLSSHDNGKLPAYEDLSERDFVACTEAAKLVTTLARYLVEYLGPKKMIKEAVPRLLLLLKIVEKAEGRLKHSKASREKTFLLKDGDSQSMSTALTSHGFKILQKYTPLFTMTENVFSLLKTLVEAMGPHLSEADLYQFTVHPILLSCLDKRQDEDMQKMAYHFYHSTLSQRNENLVWLVLNSAQDEKSIYPAFLHRPELDLQKVIATQP